MTPHEMVEEVARMTQSERDSFALRLAKTWPDIAHDIARTIDYHDVDEEPSINQGWKDVENSFDEWKDA